MTTRAACWWIGAGGPWQRPQHYREPARPPNIQHQAAPPSMEQTATHDGHGQGPGPKNRDTTTLPPTSVSSVSFCWPCAQLAWSSSSGVQLGFFPSFCPLGFGVGGGPAGGAATQVACVHLRRPQTRPNHSIILCGTGTPRRLLDPRTALGGPPMTQSYFGIGEGLVSSRRVRKPAAAFFGFNALSAACACHEHNRTFLRLLRTARKGQDSPKSRDVCATGLPACGVEAVLVAPALSSHRSKPNPTIVAISLRASSFRPCFFPVLRVLFFILSTRSKSRSKPCS